MMLKKYGQSLLGMVVMAVGLAIIPLNAWVVRSEPSTMLIVAALALTAFGALVVMPNQMHELKADVIDMIKAWRGGNAE